jgi:hypothetical protein
MAEAKDSKTTSPSAGASSQADTSPAAGLDRATAQRGDAVAAATEGDPDQHTLHRTGLVPPEALQKMEERVALGIPEPPKLSGDEGTKLVDAGAGTFLVMQEAMDREDVGPGTVLGHYDPRKLSADKK